MISCLEVLMPFGGTDALLVLACTIWACAAKSYGGGKGCGGRCSVEGGTQGFVSCCTVPGVSGALGSLTPSVPWAKLASLKALLLFKGADTHVRLKRMGGRSAPYPRAHDFGVACMHGNGLGGMFCTPINEATPKSKAKGRGRGKRLGACKDVCARFRNAGGGVRVRVRVWVCQGVCLSQYRHAPLAGTLPLSRGSSGRSRVYNEAAGSQMLARRWER